MIFNGIYVKIDFGVIKLNLYKEILSRVLEQEEIHVTFPNLKIDAGEIVEQKSYLALLQIKAILDDEECFMKIERIISVFEDLGSSGGSRHDFG